MKIEAEIQNLNKILVSEDKFYQIPDFQRPYSWDKDNVTTLIDDLLTAYIESKKSQDQDGKKSQDQDERYFCGSLVLVENKKDDKLDVIDGQQRITTFIIISCVLRDMYYEKLKENEKNLSLIKESIKGRFKEEGGHKKSKLLTNVKYRSMFKNKIVKEINFKETKNIEKEIPDNRYLQNAHYIKFCIEEKISEDFIDINEFVEWLFSSVVLTVITCPSEDNAIEIFNVLNNRGMPLSPIDIIKSHLMQKIKNNEEDRDSFRSTWDDIVDYLKRSDFNMDEMLRAYLHYNIATNPQKRLDKELQVVFDNFGKQGKDPIQIIDEIKDFSEAYIKARTKDDKYVYCLRYLQHGIYWHSILSTAVYQNYSDIDKLKSLLVAYYYQNWISGATASRIKQTSFNVLKSVKDNESIESIKQIFVENLKRFSTIETFKENIGDNWVFHRPWAKAILLLIEYFYSDGSSKNFIPINSMHCEHILPVTPTDEWKKIFPDENIRSKWTNSLANLTLLSERKNSQASNKPFKEKVEAYNNKDELTTEFFITQYIIHLEKWDVSELEERKKILIYKIMKELDLFG